jgi:hypothetical protein
MTSIEMRDLFLLKYDINGNVGVGFEDSEIYELLTKAQNDVTLEVFYKYGYRAVEKLTVDSDDSIDTDNGECGHYLELNNYRSDGLVFITGRVKLTRVGYPIVSKPSIFEVELISPASEEKFRCSSFNKTIFQEPKLIMKDVSDGGRLYDGILYIDSYSNIEDSAFMYTYLRKPNPINEMDDPELDLKWHEKIVDKAVEAADISTSNQRAQLEHQINSTKI